MTDRTIDLVSRMRSVLPTRWFPDSAPVLESVLNGLATGWSVLFDLLDYVKAQARLGTASEVWLDLIASDYFGTALKRRSGQSDPDFRARIQAELLRERNTRGAVCSLLTDLTGRAPEIFEPANSSDTGGYGGSCNVATGLAYGLAGGWGSLMLPFQAFVTAFRPTGSGIARAPGWGSGAGCYGGGSAEYAALDMIAGQVTDLDLHRAVSSVLPAASICWIRIRS